MQTIKYVSRDLLTLKKGSWNVFKSRKEIIKLADSIASVGLLNPLVIQANESTFTIVDGNSRYIAMVLLGRTSRLPRSLNAIPCILKEDVKSKTLARPILLSDSQLVRQIEDKLAKGICGQAIALMFDCGSEVVQKAQSLKALHPEIRAAFNRDDLSFEQACAFATIPNQKAQMSLLMALGPFSSVERIIAAIDGGDTVVGLPDGNVLILPSRRKETVRALSNMAA